MKCCADATSFVFRGVNGKSRLSLFRKVVATVVARGQLQIHAGLLVVSVFVFDANVGQGNLPVHDLEAVFLGDFLFTLFLFIRRQGLDLCEVFVEFLLQFVVEDDAKILSAIVFNSLCGLLVETVEGRVVSGFAGLHEALMKDLLFVDAVTPVVLDKVLAVTSKGE